MRKMGHTHSWVLLATDWLPAAAGGLLEILLDHGAELRQVDAAILRKRSSTRCRHTRASHFYGTTQNGGLPFGVLGNKKTHPTKIELQWCRAIAMDRSRAYWPLVTHLVTLNSAAMAPLNQYTSKDYSLRSYRQNRRQSSFMAT